MPVAELQDERIGRILDAVNQSDISSIKSVVSGIIQLINDPRSTAKDLKDIIQVDPPLSGKILRVSNSAFYSPQTKIDEIEKAVIWIGYNSVKELALRQKACEVFENNDSIEGYRRSELWAFCVGVAMFSKMIYRREFREKGEVIYAAGLLHKIGLIAEEQFLRKAFTKILKLTNEKNIDLMSVEEKVFGFNHAFLGEQIARNWLLPEDMVYSMGYHNNPYEAPKNHFRQVATLYVASAMCHFAEIGFSKATPFNDDLYQKCISDLKLDQDDLNLIIEDGKYEIAEMLEKGAL
ncbi:MAG: HDOD domain-containing protein [Calditrichaeota bacterium]|nr:MAG: HDOD domain-containing protein [Calditrichota bacterium]MBL1204059.1 HDOD domain-containing protein [Calditrichota bacterium]NOG43890.1 HDOD domain-containing protein [Calditrichota bacterium]